MLNNNIELLKSLNILVLEDDRVTAAIIQKYLSDIFNSIYIASNGMIGLAEFLKNRYDLILTDIYMPEMNGVEFIKEVRKIDDTIPIVVMTSTEFGIDFIELLNLSINRFIQKPFNRTQLISTIFDACGNVILRQRLMKEKEMELQLLKYKEMYNTNQQKAAYLKELNLIINDLNLKKLTFNCNDFIFNSFYQPMEILCGDVYSFRYFNNGVVFGVILDTMGKGLSAAVTSVLSIAFLNHAVDISLDRYDFDFLKTLNSFLNYIKKALLSEEIVTASFFMIDLIQNHLQYAHCGMPPILMKLNSCDVEEIKSNNPPISKYTDKIIVSEIKLDHLDSLLIYSDGLVESYDDKGQIYSSNIINDFKKLNFFSEFEKLYSSNVPSFQDDVTVFFMKKLNQAKIWEINTEISTTQMDIYRVNDELESFLTRKGVKDEIISNIKLTFYELLMNAYEHGNLGIDIDFKQKLIKEDRYDEYLLKSEKRCDKKIKIVYGIYELSNKRYFGGTITDEGEGFDISKSNRSLENTELFCGRGIILTKIVVDALHYNLKGNEVTFFIKLTP
ncbi:MAG: response regulator [Deferribacterales bacterium]